MGAHAIVWENMISGEDGDESGEKTRRCPPVERTAARPGVPRKVMGERRWVMAREREGGKKVDVVGRGVLGKVVSCPR